MSMGLGLELYFRGLGDKASIKNHTLDDFKFRNGGLFVLYLAAVILAVVQHYQAHPGFVLAADAAGDEVVRDDQADADSTHDELLPDDHSLAVADTDHSANSIHDEANRDTGGHRVLSSSSYAVHSLDRAIWDIYDLPMTLTAAAYLLRFVLSSVRFHLRNKEDDVRSWYIPANIDFLIHRYGEFIMLMIGEGVLSLLVIETVEVTDYYVVVMCGMLTMIFIYVLKTESEPHDSSTHAM